MSNDPILVVPAEGAADDPTSEEVEGGRPWCSAVVGHRGRRMIRERVFVQASAAVSGHVVILEQWNVKRTTMPDRFRRNAHIIRLKLSDSRFKSSRLQS